MIYAVLQARNPHMEMLTVEIRAPVLAASPLGARYCDKCRDCGPLIHLTSRQP